MICERCKKEDQGKRLRCVECSRLVCSACRGTRYIEGKAAAILCTDCAPPLSPPRSPSELLGEIKKLSYKIEKAEKALEEAKIEREKEIGIREEMESFYRTLIETLADRIRTLEGKDESYSDADIVASALVYKIKDLSSFSEKSGS